MVTTAHRFMCVHMSRYARVFMCMRAHVHVHGHVGGMGTTSLRTYFQHMCHIQTHVSSSLKTFILADTDEFIGS